MATQRTPREKASRTAETRPTDAWIEPSKLPTPEPRDGFAHRWIRVSTNGKADVTNASRRFREGFVPVAAADYPELMLQPDEGSRFTEGLEVGGLLLCKIPQEQVDRRTAFYAQKAQDQSRAVDENFFRDDHPNMRKFAENESRTEFKKG